MPPVNLALAGVGNCASALVQGLHYYADTGPSTDPIPGLMHPEMGGYGIADIVPVAAFDIDERKVGTDLSEAITAEPNCAIELVEDLPSLDVPVHMGPVDDGFAEHLSSHERERRFAPADTEPCDVARVLEETDADVLVNFLPVGSQAAAEAYAAAAIEAQCAFVNCIPVFIASDPDWADRFSEAGVPVVGDDIKSQIGATIVHRALAKIFADRGVAVDHTYQLNTGGNTDFLNMLEQDRLASKKISKTEAIQSQLPERLPDEDIHIGPSDYVPWQKDNKVCFLRIEGRNFGDSPVELELRLSVEDSPNSAGVVIDAVRGAKIAMDRGESGPITALSAYFMKHPPEQLEDSAARDAVEAFIERD